MAGLVAVHEQTSGKTETIEVEMSRICLEAIMSARVLGMPKVHLSMTMITAVAGLLPERSPSP